MTKIIKKSIKNLPNKLQMHVDFILQVRESDELLFDLYNRMYYIFEKLINKYMKKNFSRDYEYYVDDINKYYIIIKLEYIL